MAVSTKIISQLPALTTPTTETLFVAFDGGNTYKIKLGDFKSSFPFSGSASITGSLSVSGSCRITNGLTVTGSLFVKGGLTLDGPIRYIKSTFPLDYLSMNTQYNWAMGINFFEFDENFYNKFDVLAINGGASNFSLVAGTVHGRPISNAELYYDLPPDYDQFIYMTSSYVNIGEDFTVSNLVYANKGYGLAPQNYPNFLNDVFIAFGLGTRATGSMSPSTYGWHFDYCKTDDFFFVFLETGYFSTGTNPNQLSPVLYSIQSVYGQGLVDSFVNGSSQGSIFSLAYNTNENKKTLSIE